MAQVRTASLTREQAERIDRLADEVGGISKAFQLVIDFYILWHDNVAETTVDVADDQMTPEQVPA